MPSHRIMHGDSALAFSPSPDCSVEVVGIHPAHVGNKPTSANPYAAAYMNGGELPGVHGLIDDRLRRWCRVCAASSPSS